MISGQKKKDDLVCELEVEEGYKIISFSGVMEVMFNDCRLLNLAINSKQLYDDCESAEKSVSFKEIIESNY